MVKTEPQGSTPFTCPSPRLSTGLLGSTSMAVDTLQGRTAEVSAEWPGWPVGRNLSTALTSVFSSQLWADWFSLCKWRNWDEVRCLGATQLRGPELERDLRPATTGPWGWPCSPALSSLPDKLVGRQQSKDLGWNFSAAPRTAPQRLLRTPPQGRTLTALPLREQRLWFCSLLAGSWVEGGEGRGIWGVDEGKREGEREKEIGERKGRQFTFAKSGFSMETKVPVCLKMPLKRKIVNHFPPRRQRWLPGFDSWIWKTFLSITPMLAPMSARCYGAYF